MRSGQQGDGTSPDRERDQAAVAAVAGLPAPDPVAALAHLLTPRRCVVGVHVRLSSGRMTFRGRSCGVFPDDLPRTARAVAALVAATVQPTDTFCDLRLAPHRWLKPVRTGAYVLLAGAVELFGSPVLRVRSEVASPDVVAAVSAAAAYGRWDDLARADVAVRAEPDVVTVAPAPAAQELRPVDATRGAGLLLEAADACAEVGDQLGAVRRRWVPQPPVFPNTVQVVGDLELRDGSVLEVPLTQTPGGRLAGVPLEEMVLGVTGGGAPAGYVASGMRLRDGLTVVEHQATGVRAALKRLPR